MDRPAAAALAVVGLYHLREQWLWKRRLSIHRLRTIAAENSLDYHGQISVFCAEKDLAKIHLPLIDLRNEQESRRCCIIRDITRHGKQVVVNIPWNDIADRCCELPPRTLDFAIILPATLVLTL